MKVMPVAYCGFERRKLISSVGLLARMGSSCWTIASYLASLPKSNQRAPSAYTICGGWPPPHEHASWLTPADAGPLWIIGTKGGVGVDSAATAAAGDAAGAGEPALCGLTL